MIQAGTAAQSVMRSLTRRRLDDIATDAGLPSYTDLLIVVSQMEVVSQHQYDQARDADDPVGTEAWAARNARCRALIEKAER